MAERIFIGVAWPYANGPLHLGHIAGAYLPADIFARYHRLKGNEVLMVSGSDQHGTPVTLRAEAEGKTPQEVVARYHQGFLDCWKKLGISFDLFSKSLFRGLEAEEREEYNASVWSYSVPVKSRISVRKSNNKPMVHGTIIGSKVNSFLRNYTSGSFGNASVI